MKANRFAALLLCAMLLLGMVVIHPHAAPADTVYVQKHVSLVYDNSGSMSMELDNTQNLKWTYASYAAQIFAGLLNETDSLTMTLMNPNHNTKTVQIDLAGDRQNQVDQIREVTNYARGDTPYNSVVDAEQVLVEKGLLTDEQIGDNQINKSEQFWLVLTTDGNFDKKSLAETEADLETLLKKYSNLQVVYFGIGTEGDMSDNTAIDLRNSQKLTAYPNFTAVYAEKQEQIVSTMQALANRISGRYSVTKGIQFNGTEVTLRISGETSPIRNIALLAQQTNTKLLSAVDEDGREMTVARIANEQFPHNSSYDNIPEGTKGAHTALITCPDGKFPPGTVKLTFSEPVNEKDFSLMYEPAVYVSLTLQQKDASGQWVDISYGQKVRTGTPIRVDYVICEDGTDTPIDAAKLPGMTTEKITCGDKVLSRNGEFSAPSGTSNITATVSMMDGAYTISTVRSLQAVDLGDYTVQVSDALEFYPDELAVNTDRHIDFKVLHQGQPATADLLSDFTVESGDLQGTLTTPEMGVFRFTPKQENCQPGKLQVNLCLLGQSISSQTVTVKELVIDYAAKAGENLTLFSNEVAGNLKPVVFTVTRLRNTETSPLPEEEAGDFRIEAVSADGTVLKGTTKFVSGQLHFIADDSNAQPGNYTVTLYRQDAALASAQITILKYNAQFTAEVFQVGDGQVDLFDLRNNESALAFVIYADDAPCTGTQLEGMVGTMLLLQHNAPEHIIRNNVSIGTYDGKAALLVQPTSTAKNTVQATLQKLGVAWNLLIGKLDEGPLTVELTIKAEKGTQVTGNLDMVYDQADCRFWLIIMAILVALVLVILFLLFVNLSKPRIARGKFYYYRLIASGDDYKVDYRGTTKVKWLLALTNKPQKMDVSGNLKVQANAPGFLQLPCPPVLPMAVLQIEGSALENYFYKNQCGAGDALLRILVKSPTGCRISAELVDPVLNTASLGAGKEPKEKPYTFTKKLSSRAIFWHIRNQGKILDIWVYETEQ